MKKLELQRESSETSSNYGDSGKIDRYKQKLTNNTDADAYFVAFENYLLSN